MERRLTKSGVRTIYSSMLAFYIKCHTGIEYTKIPMGKIFFGRIQMCLYLQWYGTLNQWQIECC